MALEQEIQEQEAAMDKKNAATPQEENKNFDDLTDEEIEAVKELEQSAWWEVLKKCMKKRIEKQEKDVVILAKDNFMNPKPDWYTYYEVLGALLVGMGEMERLVNVLIADPEEIKKAQEELRKLEAQMRWEK